MLLFFDRIVFMPNRVFQTWLYSSGLYLGDPLSGRHDIIIYNGTISFAKKLPEDDSNKIINENRNKNFYFIGCYFNYLVLLEKDKLDFSFYEAK